MDAKTHTPQSPPQTKRHHEWYKAYQEAHSKSGLSAKMNAIEVTAHEYRLLRGPDPNFSYNSPDQDSYRYYVAVTKMEAALMEDYRKLTKAVGGGPATAAQTEALVGLRGSMMGFRRSAEERRAAEGITEMPIAVRRGQQAVRVVAAEATVGEGPLCSVDKSKRARSKEEKGPKIASKDEWGDGFYTVKKAKAAKKMELARKIASEDDWEVVEEEVEGWEMVDKVVKESGGYMKRVWGLLGF